MRLLDQVKLEYFFLFCSLEKYRISTSGNCENRSKYGVFTESALYSLCLLPPRPSFLQPGTQAADTCTGWSARASVSHSWRDQRLHRIPRLRLWPSLMALICHDVLICLMQWIEACNGSKIEYLYLHIYIYLCVCAIYHYIYTHTCVWYDMCVCGYGLIWNGQDQKNTNIVFPGPTRRPRSHLWQKTKEHDVNQLLVRKHDR